MWDFLMKQFLYPFSKQWEIDYDAGKNTAIRSLFSAFKAGVVTLLLFVYLGTL